jgi:alanine dehydrogenase
MPGAVSRTSTFALTNATLPWVITIAEQGWPDCATDNPNLLDGINIAKGKVTHRGVADAFNLPHHPIESVF